MVTLESLEPRQLCSSTPAAAIHPSTSTSAVTLAAAAIPKIRGVYSGHLFLEGLKVELTLTILTHTHTGRFTGTARLVGSFLASELNGTVTGHVTATRHLSISINASGIPIYLSGHATSTGGKLSGSYPAIPDITGVGGTWNAFRSG